MTLMQMLKEQTATAHERIEAEFRLSERLASTAQYKELLQRLLTFHDAWETQAARWIEPALLAPRRKAQLLRDDIAVLGGADGGVDAVAPSFHFIADEASALGAMYVVEGSSLGGALIAKQVQRRLGFTAADGCSFFRAYGDDLGARWREFGAYVNARVPAGREAKVVAAANATFDEMRAALVGPTWPKSSEAA